MEVHAHTHTPRKKWTHYFWEFLMLFLAVFCGFLAEYQLEHIVEHNREKQFIESIIGDLSQDTIALNRLLTKYEIKGKDLDSLMILLNAPDIKEKGASVYFKGRTAARMEYFNPIDRTILQMKNSGGFRMIRNDKASTAILDYYARINFIEELQNTSRQQAEAFRNFSLDIFDPLVFESMIFDSTNSVKMPEDNPALLSYDKKLLTRFTGLIHYFNGSTNTLSLNFLFQKQNAITLISILKKEYHLK